MFTNINQLRTVGCQCLCRAPNSERSDAHGRERRFFLQMDIQPLYGLWPLLSNRPEEDLTADNKTKSHQYDTSCGAVEPQ